MSLWKRRTADGHARLGAQTRMREAALRAKLDFIGMVAKTARLTQRRVIAAHRKEDQTQETT